MKKTALKTALAALVLSCCPSAALAGDFDDMKEAFDANLQSLIQIRNNIDNTDALWAVRKPLLNAVDAEVWKARQRAKTFDALLNSARNTAGAIPAVIQELDAEIADLERRKPALLSVTKDLRSVHSSMCTTFQKMEVGHGRCPGGN